MNNNLESANDKRNGQIDEGQTSRGGTMHLPEWTSPWQGAAAQAA